MHLNYQIIKILGNCFRNINCFQFWSISNIDTTTTHPYSFPAIFVEFLHRHLCRISLWPTETSLQHTHCHVLHQFSYFPDLIWPHATIIGYTKPYAKPMLIKFIVKLYTNHNTLLVKHATYQKAESLRGGSLSKLDNIVNNNSIFNTECPELSTKWYVLFHFTILLVYTTIPTTCNKNPLPHFSYVLHLYSDLTCSKNHLCNLH